MGDLQSRASNTISVKVIFSCKFQIIQSFTPKKVEKTRGCSWLFCRGLKAPTGVAGVLIDEVDSVAPLRLLFCKFLRGQKALGLF